MTGVNAARSGRRREADPKANASPGLTVMFDECGSAGGSPLRRLPGHHGATSAERAARALVATAAGTLPRRIRSLLRHRGADIASPPTSRSMMRAVPTSDASFVSEAAAANQVPIAEPSQTQPTFSSSPTPSQTWCPSCGRPQTDPMTGLMDRWMWAHSAAALLDRFGDRHDPITLLLADLDRFKSINDSAGHVAGDAVLAAVAEVIRSETRAGDLWGRYGSYAGDEFVGFLPGASLAGAIGVAERLQRHVAALRVPVAGASGVQEICGVSISIGLASHETGRVLDDMLAQADMALLAAKRSGRNRVCVANERMHAVIAHSGGHVQGNEWRQRDHAG